MNPWFKKSHIIFVLFIIFAFALSGCRGTPAPVTEDKAKPAISDTADKTQDERQSILELARQGQLNKEMSYTLVITGAGISSESNVWYKNSKLKADSLLNGQRSITIFDRAKGEVLAYLPNENVATKIKLDEYQGQDNITPTDNLQQLDQSGFLFSGTETVNKIECKVITQMSEGVSYKQWINTQNGLTVKIEEDFNGEKITIEFQDIQLENISDVLFDLPQEVEVMDFNAMMQNRPDVN